MQNNDDLLIADKILVGEALYAQALDIIIASAECELLVFDQDLSHGEFASKQKYALFQAFLSKNSNSQLTMILQDATFYQEKCPRLMDLQTIYGHKMTIYQTNASAKHAKDCFVLADGQHYVKRIHIDQARFRYQLNDIETTALLHARFKELLEVTEDIITVTRLGL